MRTVTPAEATPRLSLTVTVQTKSVAVLGIAPFTAESTPVFWLKVSQEGNPVQLPPFAAPEKADATCMPGIELAELLPEPENCSMYGGVPPLIN